MKLKTISKMNIYGKYIMNWCSHIVDAFFILFFFLLMVSIIITVIKFMYKPDFFNVIGDYAKFLLIIDFYICEISIYKNQNLYMDIINKMLKIYS